MSYTSKIKKKLLSKENIAFADKIIKDVNNKILSFLTGIHSLTKYQWLTSLSQLVSRICIEINSMSEIVLTIIIEILLEYPQQSIWSVNNNT
jgi:serine/threonine-protein kinase ATR